nr:6-phospho-3-hexuloisomerase [Micromonospora sp. DSM 115978]
MEIEQHGVREGCRLALNEIDRVVGDIDWSLWETLPAVLRQARLTFTVGNGRSGLVMRMAAMRFMHVGLTAHVVGETTTPAIASGDVLIAVSGSGSTNGVLHAARQAVKAGATVVAVTANGGSELAGLADVLLTIPAPEKTDRDTGRGSQQYAGSLFEQSVLLAFEGVFVELWRQGGEDVDEMYRRHANLG